MPDDVEFYCPDCGIGEESLVFTPNGVFCRGCGWIGDDSQVGVCIPFIGPLTLEETYG